MSDDLVEFGEPMPRVRTGFEPLTASLGVAAGLGAAGIVAAMRTGFMPVTYALLGAGAAFAAAPVVAIFRR